MRYNQARAKYWKKRLEDPLPPLPEDERIYLDVPYMAREFAKFSRCGFDPVKKLWFTGCRNSNLYGLLQLYKVNPATSEKAKQLMQEALSEKIIDVTGAELRPGKPDECEGNGEHPEHECCCDECDYYLDCFPEAMPGAESAKAATTCE